MIINHLKARSLRLHGGASEPFYFHSRFLVIASHSHTTGKVEFEIEVSVSCVDTSMPKSIGDASARTHFLNHAIHTQVHDSLGGQAMCWTCPTRFRLLG